MEKMIFNDGLHVYEVVPIHGNSGDVNVVRDGKKVRKVSAFHFPKELTDDEKAKLVALFNKRIEV